MRKKFDTHQNYTKRTLIDSGSEVYYGYGSGIKEASDLGKQESGYAATPLTVTGSGTDVRRIKFKKSGNDILVQQSNDGSTYSNVQVVSGALSGISTFYVKVLFAAPSGTNKIRVRKVV